jgi:hypothetical protein
MRLDIERKEESIIAASYHSHRATEQLNSATNWLCVLGVLGGLAVLFLKASPPRFQEHQASPRILRKAPRTCGPVVKG